MFSRFIVRSVVVLAAALAVSVAVVPAALAHDRRDVGTYQFTVGFIVEPAVEGQKNGVDLRVTNRQTNQPVEGVEKTLKVELTYVPTQTSRTFELRTIFRDPGHYTADLIPTAAGHYRMRFFGEVQELAVNETFESESGGGHFGDVDPVVDALFPEQVPQSREMAAAARGAEQRAVEARDAASSARTLAIVGVVVGAVGLAVGAGGLMAAVRRRTA